MGEGSFVVVRAMSCTIYYLDAPAVCLAYDSR